MYYLWLYYVLFKSCLKQFSKFLNIHLNNNLSVFFLISCVAILGLVWLVKTTLLGMVNKNWSVSFG